MPRDRPRTESWGEADSGALKGDEGGAGEALPRCDILALTTTEVDVDEDPPMLYHIGCGCAGRLARRGGRCQLRDSREPGEERSELSGRARSAAFRTAGENVCEGNRRGVEAEAGAERN